MHKKLSLLNTEHENHNFTELSKTFNSNTTDQVVHYIVEKIISNVLIEINTKKLDSLLNICCSNHLITQVNNMLSQKYLCHETETPTLIFNDNFIRENDLTETYNITQPSGGLLDRWKIFKDNVVPFKNHNMPESVISEKSEAQSFIGRTNSIRTTKVRRSTRMGNKHGSITPLNKSNIKHDSFNESKEFKKPKKYFMNDENLFPSFPLDENLFEKEKYPENLEKEIEIYRQDIIEKEKQNLLLKMELEQSKENEKIINGRKEIKPINSKKNTKKKPYNEFIYKVRKINVDDLKSEFVSAIVKTKGENKNKKLPLNNSTDDKRKSILEKSTTNEFDYKLTTKSKQNQPIIVAGSSFKNFVPEIGVILNQNGSIKNGGVDFHRKYKKLSLEEFSKTLEYFKKNYVKNENKNDENKNSNENISEVNKQSNYNTNINSNNNSNILNNINQKSLMKSTSLPDLNQSATNFNNDSNNIINNLYAPNKSSFYKTNFNNSLMNMDSKYGNNILMKTSSSLKLLFSSPDENLNSIVGNQTKTNKTSQKFFQQFDFKNIDNKNKNSFKKIQDFNFDIIKNNNWGSYIGKKINNDFSINNKPKFGKSNVFIRSFYRPFRVRNNYNDQYITKMNVANQINLRSQSTGKVDFRKK